MAVEDVITILTEYCEDGKDAFQDRRGPEAVIAARDVIDLLREQLSGQLAYDALWDEFEAAPRETAADLAGALEAMIEADPGLADKLEALLQEYYATSGPAGPTIAAEALASQPSEFMPREGSPLERHEAEPRRHTDDAGEGTYLYGNVPGGDARVEKAQEPGPDVLEVRRDLEMVSVDVRELFEQLQVTVEREAGLSTQDRRELRQELQALEVEIMLGEEANEERIVEQLRRVGDLDQDILTLLLTGLQHTRSEAQDRVQSAIKRASQ